MKCSLTGINSLVLIIILGLSSNKSLGQNNLADQSLSNSGSSNSGSSNSGSFNSIAFNPIPVARLISSNGKIRIKHVGQAIWENIESKVDLFPGEKIFVGTSSEATIEYFRPRGIYQLKENSLFRVGTNPPALVHFQRKFGVEKGSKKGEGAVSDQNERIIARPDDISTDPNQSQLEIRGGELIQSVRPLQIEYPKNRTLLAAQKYPAQIPILVSASDSETPLWAYVWKKGEGSTPVSKIFSRGNFANIPFKSNGTYTIQVVCEDESCASQPLQIEVIKATANQGLEAIQRRSHESETTVIFQ